MPVKHPKKAVSPTNTSRIDEMIRKRMDFQKDCHLKNLEKAKAQLKDCTFKPKVISKKGGKHKDVHEQLYLMAKRKATRADKTSEEVEFEKAKQECTFTPSGICKNTTIFKYTSPQKSTREALPIVKSSLETTQLEK